MTAMSDPTQHIQFGEGIRPVKTATSQAYNKDLSLSEKTGTYDLEERALRIADDDLNKKKKQVRKLAVKVYASPNGFTKAYTGWTLAWLAFQSTGVIYGDIGTSPLYGTSSLQSFTTVVFTDTKLIISCK